MADIVQSLFGVTPQAYQQAQQARMDAQALQYAKLDPFQQANYAIGRGASGLAGAIGGALGGQDPELQRITMRQQIAGQLNPNDLSTFDRGIEMMRQGGDGQGALMLQMERDKAQQLALTRGDDAATRRELAIKRQLEETARAEQAQVEAITRKAYTPPEQLLGIGAEGTGETITPAAFNLQSISNELLQTERGRAQLEKLQKAQTSIDEVSANQLAAQLFNPDGTRNKAVEAQLRSSLTGQKILKTVEPETKVFKKGETLAKQNPVTGAWDVVTLSGVVTTPVGANPITAMLQSGSISPTVRAYAAELETQWPDLDPNERRAELSKLATKNQTATTILQKAAEARAGGNEKVQSSKVTPDGTTIMVMKDGTTKVESAAGVLLTGQARVDAIRASELFGAQVQRDRAQSRGLGEFSAKQVGQAFAEVAKIKKNIGNIDEAIAAIDSGANTGVIASKLPNVTTASIQLANIRQQLGLDVIGSVTFGALSEGELNLALDTALPTGLQPQELRKFLVNKKTAQTKLATYLTEQASYLSKTGNTLDGWLETIEKRGTAPAAPAALPKNVTVKKIGG